MSNYIVLFPLAQTRTLVISKSNADEVDEQTSESVRTQLESVLKRH